MLWMNAKQKTRYPRVEGVSTRCFLHGPCLVYCAGEVHVSQDQGGTEPTCLTLLMIYYTLLYMFVGIHVYICI